MAPTSPAALTPAAILDAIARKHSGCALVREVVVTDPAARAASEQWWARHHENGLARADDDPYPDLVWTRRIDALMLDGGATRTAIEVKVTRPDFLRESDGKRDPWRAITHRFVYATPAGLLDPQEIPDGCGLWEVDSCGAVRIVKRARTNKTPEAVPHQVVVALAYRAARVAVPA